MPKPYWLYKLPLYEMKIIFTKTHGINILCLKETQLLHDKLYNIVGKVT